MGSVFQIYDELESPNGDPCLSLRYMMHRKSWIERGFLLSSVFLFHMPVGRDTFSHSCLYILQILYSDAFFVPIELVSDFVTKHGFVGGVRDSGNANVATYQ